MIRVNLPLAITILVSVPIILVLFSALFYTSVKDDIVGEISSLQQCPYCVYTFRSQNNAQIVVCPQCHSLIDSLASISVNSKKQGNDNVAG